jgi:hypothetical protein
MLSNRRRFLAAAGAAGVAPVLKGESGGDPDLDTRARAMYDIRMDAATVHLTEKAPVHAGNGDEGRYPSRI